MHPLDWASLVTAFAAGVTGSFLLLRRRSAMSSLALAVVMLAGSVWAVLGLLATQVDDPALVVTLDRGIITVAAVQAASATWFCLTLAGHRLHRRHAAAFAVEPVLLVLAVLTDPWTGLILTEVHTSGPVVLEYGVGFWVHTAYCYALLVAGGGALLRAATRAVPGHRLHYLMGLLAMTPPVLGNMVSVLGFYGGSRDLTAPLFLVTALLWLWVDRVSARFRTAPITTPQVLRALTDGVLVIDAVGRLVGVNPAARRLLLRPELADSSVVGAHWRDVCDPELIAAVIDGGASSVRRADGSVVDIRITPVMDGGIRTGWVVAARDITEVERLRCELAEQAVRDGLTGLHNRRHLEPVLAAAILDHAPLSVAVLDIDRFKTVNDRFGHLVGDRVLVAVADALRVGVREGDTVARLGGEEFVLVLPGLSAAEAAEHVDLVRRDCAQQTVPTPAGATAVTVSAGVAQHQPGQDVVALIAAADGALYAAKAAGRDRVVVAGAVPAPR